MMRLAGIWKTGIGLAALRNMVSIAKGQDHGTEDQKAAAPCAMKNFSA